VGTRALPPRFSREGIVPITEFPAGGLGAGFAPETWAQYVLDNLGAASVLLASGATEIRTEGKNIHVPRFTGDAATNWYDELEEIGEGCPPGNELVLTPQKVAALCTLRNEVVADSNANVLDSVGQKMVRSVALAADRAMFNGTGGKQPTGILNITPALPTVAHARLHRDRHRRGHGPRGGRRAERVYVNPADLTALQLATDANDRPLIGATETGVGASVAGLTIWRRRPRQPEPPSSPKPIRSSPPCAKTQASRCPSSSPSTRTGPSCA
jgi:HK97 family phage major capsid protein